MYKLIYLKAWTSKNIFSWFVILSKLKLDISSTFKSLQPLNIYLILIKEEVLKYDKSSDINDSQPENI